MLMVLLLNFADDNATDSFEFFKKNQVKQVTMVQGI